MRVRDVMVGDIVTVHEDSPACEVAEVLLESGIRAVPVLDGDGRLVGIVEENDLLDGERGWRLLRYVLDGLRGCAEPEPIRRATAGELMSTAVETASPDDTVAEASRRMIRGGLRRLPVIEDHRLVGIVCLGDLLRFFSPRSDEQVRRDAERVVTAVLLVCPAHDVRLRVSGGVVTLEGVVRIGGDGRAIGALVEAVDGVLAVDNRLIAAARPALTDSWSGAIAW